MKRLAVFIFLPLLVSTVLWSQSISPAPTSAGFPFFYTGTDDFKVIAGGQTMWTTTDNDEIVAMGVNGSVAYFQMPANEISPAGLTYGPDGNIWYVISGSGAKAGVLNPHSRTFTEWPLTNDTILYDITAGPDGALWFPEGQQNSTSMGRITTSGVITHYPFPMLASWIRSGPDGALWAIETFGSQIARMTTDGTVTNVWNTGNSGMSCGLCASIAAGPDGAMWFTVNEQRPVIGRITMSGVITFFRLQGMGAASIAPGADGAMWFTDPMASLVGRITTEGAVTYYEPVGNQQYSRVSGQATGPDGNIYFGGQQPYLSRGFGKIVLWTPSNTVGTNFSATHGTSFSGGVASFDDLETVTGASFRASIQWGDGSTTPGTVQMTSNGSPRTFVVNGTHAYASAGSYTVKVTVTEPGDKYSFSMTATGTIQ